MFFISFSNKNFWKVFCVVNLIIIDGLEGDWGDVLRKYLWVEFDFNNYMFDLKFDCRFYVKMFWDDVNLYIFVSVFDDEIKFNMFDFGSFFNNDGVELYIDGDNSKNVVVNYFLLFIFLFLVYDSNDNLICFFFS